MQCRYGDLPLSLLGSLSTPSPIIPDTCWRIWDAEISWSLPKYQAAEGANYSLFKMAIADLLWFHSSPSSITWAKLMDLGCGGQLFNSIIATQFKGDAVGVSQGNLITRIFSDLSLGYQGRLLQDSGSGNSGVAIAGGYGGAISCNYHSWNISLGSPGLHQSRDTCESW